MQVGQDAFRPHPNRTRKTSLVLKSLVLDDNQLENLDFLVDPCSLLLGNQSVVSVRNNPIRCDCFLYNVTRFRVVQVQGACVAPTRYKGASLEGYITRDQHQTRGLSVSDLFSGNANDNDNEPLSFLQTLGGSMALDTEVQAVAAAPAAGPAPAPAGRRRQRPRKGSFLQEAERECGPPAAEATVPGVDAKLLQQYSCTCRTWKPFVQQTLLSPLEPQVAVQVQECSSALKLKSSITLHLTICGLFLVICGY